MDSGTNTVPPTPTPTPTDVFATVPNIAARDAFVLPVGATDYDLTVGTNLLTYRTFNAGATWSVLSHDVTISLSGQFAAISEPETGQSVYIVDADKRYTFNGFSWIEQ